MQTTIACLFPAALAAGALAVALPSQAILQVGNGGYPDVSAALAVANPGDTLLIAPGFYPAFVVNVGVTIRGNGFPTVIENAFGAGIVVCDIPPGQTLHFVDIEIRHEVLVQDTTATFDACTLHPSQATPSLTCAFADVHLQDCDLESAAGAAPVLGTFSSTVTILGGQVVSAPFGTTTGAVQLIGSQLQASNASFANGMFAAGAAALDLSQDSTAWLKDCAIATAGTAQCAITAATGSTARSDGCTFSESGVGCSHGVAGELLGVARSGPFALGQPFTLTFHLAPNGFVALFAAPTLAVTDWSPVLEQPVWLDPTTSFLVIALLADPMGAASIGWQMPVDPAFVGATLWLQGIGGTALPLQTSPVVGGYLR